jgi:hypothetical protein
MPSDLIERDESGRGGMQLLRRDLKLYFRNPRDKDSMFTRNVVMDLQIHIASQLGRRM